MSENSEISPSMSSRSLGEIPEISAIHLGIDLVSAAKRNITFLKSVADSQWLHQTNITVEAIRRYRDLWMPLISDLTISNSSLPMILPPFDVEWIWFCHCLNHVSYREYCEGRFSKVIGRAVINDEENREYALMRCREIWKSRYPFESFENEASSDSNDSDNVVAEGSLSLSLSLNDDEVFKEVEKQRLLCSKFMEPYRCEMLYLIAARQRYKAFLFMLQRLGSECSSRLVPTSDISLMWLTHQSYPTVYMEDLKVLALEGDMQKVATISETVKEKEFEETKILWDKAFNQPYEKAGGEVPLTLEGVISIKSPILWEESDIDVNTKYRSLLPRFLLEACVFVRLKPRIKASQKDRNRDFLRLRMIRCHSELKLDEAISTFPFDTWKKAWHVYCEFGTKGVMLEYRRHGGGNCLKRSSRQDTVSFRWNDLLRADSLTLEKEVSQQVNVVASITPPVQAPYLLKCVPDRVTDDSGAMISDVFLKMNSYRPQEGRWLSRTVLDHAGRVCFVIRIRVGGGFWRRGGETPSAVKWEDRIIEIREGSWSYVAGSIGRAPVQRRLWALQHQRNLHPRYWAHLALWSWQRYGQGADDTLPLENNGDYTRDVGFLKFSDFTSNISAADSVTVDNHLNNLWYQPEEIFPVDGIPEQRQHALWVPVDSKYYRIAKKLEEMKLDACIDSDTCLTTTPKVVLVDRGTSAGFYLDNAAYRTFIYNKFNVSPVDMESASVALICLQQRIPFIAIRALSDLAGGGTAESNEADTFSPLAATNSVAVVIEFVKLLSSHHSKW